MEYKVVLRPYDLASLIGKASGQSGTSQGACEAGDWNMCLNDYVIKGWTVKNNGTVVSGRDIIFWAMLERVEQ